MSLPPSHLPKILQFETRRLELERQLAYDRAVIEARRTRSDPPSASLRRRFQAMRGRVAPDVG